MGEIRPVAFLHIADAFAHMVYMILFYMIWEYRKIARMRKINIFTIFTVQHPNFLGGRTKCIASMLIMKCAALSYPYISCINNVTCFYFGDKPRSLQEAN